MSITDVAKDAIGFSQNFSLDPRNLYVKGRWATNSPNGVVHVTRAAAVKARNVEIGVIGKIDNAIPSWLSMPFNPAWFLSKIFPVLAWVISHARLIFFAVCVVFALIILSFLRTAWGEAHNQVRKVVRKPSTVKSAVAGRGRQQAAMAPRPASHTPGTVFTGSHGTVVCASSRGQATAATGKRNVSSAGRCSEHRSNYLYLV